ncbi:MAG: hypothetical protein VW835_09305 [Rickettsiales bacterium]|jgi:hypothetical protein
MAYNRDIHHTAPLPSGALPTQQEIDALARNTRHDRTHGVFGNIRKFFRN